MSSESRRCAGLGRAGRRREKGQAMTEYVIMLILVVVGLVMLLKTFPVAVVGYLRPIYYCVSRPIP